ncbi:ABC-type ribose transport system, auxiliary component [Desulfosporosinus acidiphilus SJ4]|uniref:D-ribose pyranase n=1 Tax=Desulfosporosinus acidiphilus (strain DSM 22704 / JCM 16185 / SJ4) TaxID=646529 RepID=I4D7C5_DESAJ|nr:D-ribose pyranase [Desulfosporosinus acidiphilus]AFM41699.1 ABC-type ribose transport system, auxiliary component [Desulfosporosinus acidiphilus SJ4]
MKKQGVLHGELSRIIATLGHGQSLVIADYGLPIPPQIPFIDLAVSEGVASFWDVFNSVLTELSVERLTVAQELQGAHPDLFAKIKGATDAPIDLVSHEMFKDRLNSASVIVRTGEWTSYANVILQSSVIF